MAYAFDNLGASILLQDTAVRPDTVKLKEVRESKVYQVKQVPQDQQGHQACGQQQHAVVTSRSIPTTSSCRVELRSFEVIEQVVVGHHGHILVPATRKSFY